MPLAPDDEEMRGCADGTMLPQGAMNDHNGSGGKRTPEPDSNAFLRVTTNGYPFRMHTPYRGRATLAMAGLLARRSQRVPTFPVSQWLIGRTLCLQLRGQPGLRRGIKPPRRPCSLSHPLRGTIAAAKLPERRFEVKRTLRRASAFGPAHRRLSILSGLC